MKIDETMSKLHDISRNLMMQNSALVEAEIVEILKLSKRKIKMPASAYSLKWHGIELHCKNIYKSYTDTTKTERIKVTQKGQQLGKAFEINTDLVKLNVTITRGMEF